MRDSLYRFLSRYTMVDNKLIDILMKTAMIRRFPNNTMVLRQGERVEYGYFVLSGCVRSYVVKNGAEYTLDFFTEEEPILPMGYGTGALATHSLQCLEDSVLLVNTPTMEEEVMRLHPELKEVCLSLAEIMAEKLQEQLLRRQTCSPEERYLHLVKKRPDLIQRIPQYQIAGYLGIQPESLSRIRSRIAKKNRIS